MPHSASQKLNKTHDTSLEPISTFFTYKLLTKRVKGIVFYHPGVSKKWRNVFGLTPYYYAKSTLQMEI